MSIAAEPMTMSLAGGKGGGFVSEEVLVVEEGVVEEVDEDAEVTGRWRVSAAVCPEK